MSEALELEPVAEEAKPYMPKAGTEDWCTPPALIDLVEACFGGPVDLDPCANPHSQVGPRTGCVEVMQPRWEAEAQALEPSRLDKVIIGDGLKVNWLARTFVNPPYGRDLDDWMDRSVRAAKAEERASVIMLAPAKTSRRCWQRTVPRAAAVAFLGGRVQFQLPGGEAFGATFASALILWTREPELTHRFAMTLDRKAGHVMWGR